MHAGRSRTAEPLPGGPRAAAMGTWGIVLTLVALAMFVAGLAAAALYLETGHDAWPPAEIPRPSGVRAWVGAAALVLAAGVATVVLRQVRSASGAPIVTHAVVVVTTVTGALFLAADLRAAPFRWDLHAYTSVYWVLTGVAVVLAAVVALMAVAVFVQMTTGVIDAERHLEVGNTVLMLWFTAATTVILLALVHFLPLVGGGS